MAATDGPERSSDESTVVAPDGIEVRPFALPGVRAVSIAEGWIPTGEYRAHCHRSIEQVTYLLAGRLAVSSSDPFTGMVSETVYETGGLISTPPLHTISFRNPYPETARVLFICAPPYPADDADTLLLDGRRAPAPAELRETLARADDARSTAERRWGERRAAVEALLRRSEQGLAP